MHSQRTISHKSALATPKSLRHCFAAPRPRHRGQRSRLAEPAKFNASVAPQHHPRVPQVMTRVSVGVMKLQVAHAYEGAHALNTSLMATKHAPPLALLRPSVMHSQIQNKNRSCPHIHRRVVLIVDVPTCRVSGRVDNKGGRTPANTCHAPAGSRQGSPPPEKTSLGPSAAPNTPVGGIYSRFTKTLKIIGREERNGGGRQPSTRKEGSNIMYT